MLSWGELQVVSASVKQECNCKWKFIRSSLPPSPPFPLHPPPTFAIPLPLPALRRDAPAGAHRLWLLYIFQTGTRPPPKERATKPSILQIQKCGQMNCRTVYKHHVRVVWGRDTSKWSGTETYQSGLGPRHIKVVWD